MNISKDDPRVLALAEVIRSIRPEMTHADASARAYAYAYAYDYDRAYAYAYDRARDYARAYDHAHDHAPFTDDEKTQINAAHALLFT